MEAIRGLNGLADEMLTLLRGEVSSDYEKFGLISQSFTGKSEDIKISMEELQGKTEQYAKALANIKDAILSVGAVSEENSAEVIRVSELLISVDEDMKGIGATTEETFSAISDMNTDLNNYRI